MSVDLDALRLTATTARNLGYDACLVAPQTVLALAEVVEAAQEQMRVMAAAPEGRFPHQDRLRAALAPFAKAPVRPS